MNRFNFRPILILTFSLILGVIIAIYSAYYKGVISIVAIISYLIICAILFLLRRKLKLRAVIVYLLAFVIFLSSNLIVENKCNQRLNPDTVSYEDVIVKGRITEIINLTRTVGVNNDYYVTIQGSIENNDEILKLGVYFSTNEPVYTGSHVVIRCDLSPIISTTFNEYLNSLRNLYSFQTNNSSLLEISSPTQFQDVLKRKILNNLKTLVPETSGVIYALITGEEYAMYQDQMLNFRKLGVSHIFAVSGLHVGFLYGLISFIFSLFKIKGKKTLPISSIILFLYVAFCGFSPSSIRALVIILVTKFAISFSFKNDKLNTFFLALAIVTLINPFNLISFGTILSFIAYGGIVFVTPSVNKLFSKILPEKFAKVLSSYLVAFLITLPIVLDYFDGVSLFASIFNFFIVPLIAIIYPFALIGVILTLFLPIKAFLLIPHILIKLINYFISIIFVDHFYVKDIVFKSSKIYYYSIFILSTGKFNLTKSEKIFIYLSLVLIFIISFISININGDIFALKM